MAKINKNDISFEKNEEWWEHSYIYGGSAYLKYSKYQYRFFRRMTLDIPQRSALSLLEIYPKDTSSYRRDIAQPC